jgi:hypothetical protein
VGLAAPAQDLLEVAVPVEEQSLTAVASPVQLAGASVEMGVLVQRAEAKVEAVTLAQLAQDWEGVDLDRDLLRRVALAQDSLRMADLIPSVRETTTSAQGQKLLG